MVKCTQEVNLVIEKAIAARRDYYRRWRKENRDKVRQYNANYWQRKAEQTARERKCNAQSDSGENKTIRVD